MNFEEANELFDSESLESRQMAKVNGRIARAALLAGATHETTVQRAFPCHHVYFVHF